MTAIEMEVDLSTLVNALVSGNNDQIIAAAHEHLHQGETADVLIGRIGMIAARGDADGHTIITLTAAAMLCRLLHTIPLPLEGNGQVHERALPLFLQALLAAAPAVQAGHNTQVSYPRPFYPSGLQEGQTVNGVMHDAVYNNDPLLVERLLLGLYGTGADYRTMEVRTYDGISTTFQDAGHPLIFAVRGFQLLDAVEWGERAPHILHWLTPHLPLHGEEPQWVQAVRAFHAEPTHSLASLRTRLSAPKDVNALPLRSLIQSDADTTQICQGVYDALMKGGASSLGAGSVIALAAADLLLRVGDGDRDEFERAAHGFLFTAAVRVVFGRVQDIAALPLLYTAAAYANALYKELGQPIHSTETASITASFGGGLITPA